MTSTDRTCTARRFATLALALPLALTLTGTTMSGTALAAPSKGSGPQAGAQNNNADRGPASASKAEQKAGPKAEQKEGSKAEQKEGSKAEPAPKAKPQPAPAPAKAGPASPPPPSSTTDKHGPVTSGPLTSPQPLSNADKNGTGANPGAACTHAYCSTRDGSASQNGNGGGNASGKPCAGCVGKADNKNPKGQSPDGSDHNNGYECDGNNGIGKGNPAHTGCQSAPSNPGTPSNPSNPGTPSTPGNPGTPGNPSTPGTPATPGTPDNPATPGTPGNPSNPGTCSDGSALPAGGLANCPTAVLVCPSGVVMSPVMLGCERSDAGTAVGDRPSAQAGSGVLSARSIFATELLPSTGGQKVLSASSRTPASARVMPSALPFTGTDAGLLGELGAVLLLAGAGLLVATRRKRTARAAS